MPSRDNWLPLSYDALRDKNVNLFKKLNSVIFPLQYKARRFAAPTALRRSDSRTPADEMSLRDCLLTGEAVPGLHSCGECDSARCACETRFGLFASGGCARGFHSDAIQAGRANASEPPNVALLAAYCLPTDILVAGIGCRYEKKEGAFVNVVYLYVDDVWIPFACFS